MTNGIFKSLNFFQRFSHARAQNVMSTQSTNGFEWSVKLIGVGHFNVGIASMIKPEDSSIWLYDPNSVLYCTKPQRASKEVKKTSKNVFIRVESKKLHSNLTKHKDGDVIRFRFQPQTKKLIIDLVRLNLFFSA